MDYEYQQHRFARIEGYNIARARLQSQFADGIGDPIGFEKALAEQVAMSPTTIAGWRQSEMEQAGCREGIRLAALEFYWEHRQAMRATILAQSGRAPPKHPKRFRLICGL